MLNDNEMSISPNVGALNKYLTRLLSAIKKKGDKLLDEKNPLKKIAKAIKDNTQNILTPGHLFEEIGFSYFGPIDGHDIRSLNEMLDSLKHKKGPLLLHVITKKGKGYKIAEKNPVKYHGVTPFDIATGATDKPKLKNTLTYTNIFTKWINHTAQYDEDFVAITPAMGEGSGMNDFSKEYPDRYYDVAIAEQHSVTFAAGLACEGLKPVVAIYSTFLQRAYDQLIHDVALQNLDVLFAIDRAGLVGLDGATHQGAFDLSFIRCIPNMVIMAPSDEAIAWKMFNSGYEYPGPVAIRYPRGIGTGASFEKTEDTIEIGKSKTVLTSDNKEVIILFFGNLFDSAIQAGKEMNARVVDMRFIKPIDEELIQEISDDYKLIVTIEDNVVAGGAGSAVNEMLLKINTNSKILNIGLPDEFIEHGDQEQQKVINGLDGEGITKSIREKLALV